MIQNNIFSKGYNNLIKGENVSTEEFTQLFLYLLSPDGDDIIKGAILTGFNLQIKDSKTLTTALNLLTKHAKTSPRVHGAIDIVGTGGDGLNTINISTASSFIVAAAGGTVIKHGNRSATSLAGSSDFLEALGINLGNLDNQDDKFITDHNLTFLFAPHYHPSLKHVKEVRTRLKQRTIFNILGPLANPSKPDYMVLGVSSPDLLDIMANILKNVGIKKALVVHGIDDGCDEVSISGGTSVLEVTPQEIKRYTIKPEDFNLKSFSNESIKGGSAQDNVDFVLNIFKNSPDGIYPMKAALALNSGVALYTCGVSKNIEEGVKLALATIEDGKAMNKLKEYVEATK